MQVGGSRVVVSVHEQPEVGAQQRLVAGELVLAQRAMAQWAGG